jgi:outer membrane protein OmpA-like peptidoglycan-associated protein
VAVWLSGKGIDAARLSVAGLGDTQPVADNTTEEGRRRNRRVVLVKQ